ncbi:MAG: SUMF1/EgtB/PvdO family nonheme iron enzyme [Bacteroidota bacterium]
MKKATSGFLEYRLSSGWRLLGKIGTVYLCLCFGFPKMTIAQPGNKTIAAVKGLSPQIPGLPSDPANITWDRPALLKEERITNLLGMEMIPIKPGEFRMGNDGEIDYKQLLKDEIHTPYLGKGSPNPYIKNGPVMSENPLEWDEKPAHPVKITQEFYMASTPVTNAQYEQFRAGAPVIKRQGRFL